MTDEQITAQITAMDGIVTACNAEILRLVTTKSTYNMSTSQTQLMVVERRIEEQRKTLDWALGERDKWSSMLTGGNTIQLRPYA